MPIKRLEKARASLPAQYQFGDAAFGVLRDFECCAKFVSPHPHRAIVSTAQRIGDQMFLCGDIYVVTKNGALKEIGQFR